MLKLRLGSPAVVQVLRHRQFARLLGAQLGEDASDAICSLVLPWLVLETGGSGMALGLTGVAAVVVPFLVVGPIAGVLVDRLNRSLVMMSSDLIRASVLVIVLLMGWLTGLEIWHIATAAFLLTAADVLAFTARGAVLPSLVPREDLVAADTLGIAGWQVVNIGGRGVAGFLMVFLGSLPTLVICVGLYVIAILLLFKIREAAEVQPVTHNASPVPGVFTRVFTDLRDATVFIVQHPLIRLLTLSGMVINAFQYPLTVMLLPLFLGRVLDAGPESYGLFLATTSAGVFVSMLIAPRLARHVGEGRLDAISLALWGINLGLIAVVSDLWQALALAWILGFIGGGMVPSGSLVQIETPDYMRGKVLANIMAASLAFVPFSLLLGGAVMDGMGARPLYALAGVVVMIYGLLLLTSKVVREARLTVSMPE